MYSKRKLIAFIVIGVLGTLSHFGCDIFDCGLPYALIFPVNESVWEHLKLVFYPSAVYFLFEYIISKPESGGFWPSSLFGIYYGMLKIIIIYYTVSGIFGRNIDFVNILSYYIGVAAILKKRSRLIKHGIYGSESLKAIALAFTVITVLLFSVWSFNPPGLGIFVSPV